MNKFKIFLRDILRDTNSRKYSMTKFVTLVSVILLVIGVGSSIWIMVKKSEIDHFLIGELIALILTLLGFKNFRNNFIPLQQSKPSSDDDDNDDILDLTKNDTVN